MLKPSIQLTLEIIANVYKEGRVWVAICPSLKVASQGKTKSEAKAMLAEAVEMSLDVYREEGKIEEILLEAMHHPTNRLKPEVQQEMIRVPMDLLAARHAQTPRAHA